MIIEQKSRLQLSDVCNNAMDILIVLNNLTMGQ